MYGISVFVNEHMKQIEKEAYKSNLGPELEKYVAGTLKEYNKEYFSERDIQHIYKRLNKEGLKVDFVVPTKSAHIFVDSKAIEPGIFVNTSSNPDDLKSRLKGSFLKGLLQAQHCAALLSGEMNSLSSDKNAALIITSREHYISNGLRAAKNIDPELELNLIHDLNLIPINLSRIYFVSINDFEIALDICEQNNLDLTEIIDACEISDSDPKTEKMVFQQHLSTFGSRKYTVISSIKNARNELFQRAEYSIINRDTYWSGKIEYFLFCYDRVTSHLYRGNPSTFDY